MTKAPADAGRMTLLRPKDAATKFGVTVGTLRQWEADGVITSVRTHGKHRRFPDTILEQACGRKQRFVYCRVSSSKQKDDLTRQVQLFKETHPQHQVITDIGSGLNFKRKGLLRLVDAVLQGTVEEIVVAHRDRLCRFAFELFDWLCTRHDTKLVVQNKETQSASEELSEDLMAIVHVFSCRHHGLRRYSGKMSKGKAASDAASGGGTEEVDDCSETDLQCRPEIGEKRKSQAQPETEKTGRDSSPKRQRLSANHERDAC